MKLDFYLPTKIVSGNNCILNNYKEFLKLGNKCVIVTGASSAIKSGALFDVTKALDKSDIEYIIFNEIGPNPLLKDCIKGGKIAKDFNADFIVGIGGGSPLDGAKAISVIANNKVKDVLEGNQLNSLKLAVVGTTAGTGSEANPYSIITLDSGKKANLGSNSTYPNISFCDYKYTKSLSQWQTMGTALDALAHLTEGYFSKNANDISDLFATKGLNIIFSALKQIKEKGYENVIDDLRESLYQASIYGGIVINKAGTLFPHPLGYFTSEEFGYPHGYACNLFYEHLLNWCETNAPNKFKNLLKELSLTKDEIILYGCNYNILDIEISIEKIDEIVKEKLYTNNFLNTPGSFNKEAATEILKKAFIRE